MRSDAVKYPVLRADLKDAARDFADDAFQADVRANPTFEGLGGRWDFLEGYEFVVDDLDGSDLRPLLGQVLVAERELELYASFYRALLSVGDLERSGSRIEYREVSGSGAWRTAQLAAARLHQAMEAADAS